MAFPNAGGDLPNYLQPSQGKGLYAGNYLDFFDLGGSGQWAQQFLPDVYDKEIEIYGNRTISGFLKMVSAEMPSTSDQIIWLEQGRLHTRYSNLTKSSAAAGSLDTNFVTAGGDIASGATAGTNGIVAGTVYHFGYTAAGDRDGRPESTTSTTERSAFINFRVGQQVMIGKEGTGDKTTGDTLKGVITAVAPNGFSIAFYQDNAGFAIDASADNFTALAYGSEFAKGTGNFTEKLDPSYSTYSNAPIIMKEHYSINGSDTGQIGWIEVTSENGASGYLWYVKAEHENRLRWEDYQEMAMVEGEAFDAAATSPTNIALGSFRGDFGAAAGASSGQNARGTQGFFSALRERGNVYSDLSNDIDGTNSTANFEGLEAFDQILKQLDKQGSIEENMLYVNRDLALAFDNFLSGVNTGGDANSTSWGVFNNSRDMALDLGFQGFRRGSYDFYKTDWKYLNDFSTRGAFGDVEGVMIPAGTSTVYDQNLGKNIKRPFLHVRYRASETDNRKMKSWITGSVGGAYTTDVDEMRMHYLTERCLITQGANNFFLFEGA